MINLDNRGWEIMDRIDTRVYDRETGQFIPGSGELYQCDHCGRSHEIWVYLFNRITEDRAIVGTSCAKKAKGIADYNKIMLGNSYTTTRRNTGDFEWRYSRKDKYSAVHNSR